MVFRLWFFRLQAKYKLHHLFLVVKPTASIHFYAFIYTFSHITAILARHIVKILFGLTIKSVGMQLS